VSTYETIAVDPLTVNIGAQVEGVDLRRPLNEQQRDEIHDALMRHLVLFFRDQDLSEDQQLSFASAFGPPVSASVDTRPGAEQMIFVNLEDNADSPPKADRWHTDVPFVPLPPNIAVLNMRATPPVGGDTLWLSLYAVHDSLSPTMQALLSGLQLDFQLGASRETILELYGEDYYREVIEVFTGAKHPLVRVHPVTGRRALYLAGSFMREIVGLHPAESTAMLAFLQSRLDDPNVQCRWRWRQYDVAMWDERCTNHRAMSDHFPHYRMIRRCLAGCEAPIAVGDPRGTPTAISAPQR
jgi:taurine dioxygenase